MAFRHSGRGRILGVHYWRDATGERLSREAITKRKGGTPMGLRERLSVRPLDSDLSAVADGAGGNKPAGLFVTSAALLSFPTASVVGSAIWGVLAVVWAPFGAKIVALIIALVLGAVIYVITSTPSTTPRQRKIAMVIALINAFMLAAAMLGVVSGAQAALGPQPSPTPGP